MSLTQLKLKELFSYDPETGGFIRLTDTRNIYYQAGGPVGHLNKHGYVIMKIAQKSYPAHRLAFLYMTGKMPKFVDHINHNRSDNRWSNLRAASRAENGWNKSLQKSNTSGFIGVNRCHRTDNWVARISVNKKRIYLGAFKSKYRAAIARNRASIKHHKEFALLCNIRDGGIIHIKETA